jgi:Flp pilus assembly protein TadD
VSGGDELVSLDDVELLFDDGPAALAHGIELFVAGDLPAAVSALGEAAALLPGEAAAHAWLGRALLRGDPGGACVALRRAVGLEPDDFAAWRALAIAAARAGDAVLAGEARDRAAACAPGAEVAAGLSRDLAVHMTPSH